MEIKTIDNDGIVTISLIGRLDTNTSQEFRDMLSPILDSTKELLIDFADLDYISSAGLQVLLFAQKRMNAKNKKMKVINANDTVMEIFEITGFSEIINIETK